MRSLGGLGGVGTLSTEVADYPWRIEQLGSGDGAIYATMYKMQDIINKSSINLYVRKYAEYIIQGVDPGDKMGEIQAVYTWVQDHVRYTRDPSGTEYLQTPPHLLGIIERQGMAFGDCDDLTMLIDSLLKSIGFSVGIKVASYKPDGQFTHIYGLVWVKNQWVPLDAVKRSFVVGYEVPNATRVDVREV